MAISERQAWQTVTDSDWQQRLALAIIRQALVVFNEPGATANHARRSALATEMARSPMTWAAVLALHIAADQAFLDLATVPTGVQLNLAAMQTRVAAVFDLLAGAP